MSSLASIQTVLQRFSSVSYYKVNDTKSKILELDLDAVSRNLLQNLYPYPWADTGITYLGIPLTKYSMTLFSNNYVGVKQMLIKETAKLSKFEFSLVWEASRLQNAHSS